LNTAEWFQDAVKANSTMTPPLPPGEVHLWRARLDQQADSLAELTTILSPGERERAARLRHTVDRDRFVLRRGVLRAILSLYLAVAPSKVRFAYGRNDKPFLARGSHDRQLSFNLAHRRGIALYAVTSLGAVGVDIECVEPLADLEGVTTSSFSERELDVLRMVPESERLLAFFTGWTRKEAFLKALGEGLTRPPNQVEVYLDSSNTTEVRVIECLGARGRFWRVDTVVPVPGYVGAVAAEGGDWRIKWLDWQAPEPRHAGHPSSE
jgi:4'-phosphopantetheinyl transferase